MQRYRIPKALSRKSVSRQLKEKDRLFKRAILETRGVRLWEALPGRVRGLQAEVIVHKLNLY